MSKESFETIQKKIAFVKDKIKLLESEKDSLISRLQKVCRHPGALKYRTWESEICGKCERVLQVWPPHQGNPI